jgi:hypothetical protein
MAAEGRTVGRESANCCLDKRASSPVGDNSNWEWLRNGETNEPLLSGRLHLPFGAEGGVDDARTPGSSRQRKRANLATTEGDAPLRNPLPIPEEAHNSLSRTISSGTYTGGNDNGFSNGAKLAFKGNGIDHNPGLQRRFLADVHGINARASMEQG